MSAETDDKITDEQKIKIEWDDLKSRKVDLRLKEQEAVERNRRQAELNPVVLNAPTSTRSSIWYNSVFVMAFFGLLGGLLAWGGGEILRYPDPTIEAQRGLRLVADFKYRGAIGQLSPERAEKAIEQIKIEYGGNPFFKVEMETAPDAQKEIDRKAVQKQQASKRFLANLMAFGLTGMLIALCLSAAEKIVDRNLPAAILNGFVGAAAGLIGGVIVSLFFNRLLLTLKGTGPGDDSSQNSIIAHSIAWGVVGLFLTIAPGLLMRNVKKLAIGLLGGIVGGLIGGALYDPIFSISDGNEHLSRLVTLVAIGLFAGLGTGLIENAAKSGWMKVTAGLIAGKQFILYRSPTFIGSGPECPIYLFRDPQVGKRHAAIHIIPGGFELENLPLGGDTIVNGKAINRTRLKAGDAIQVGGTTFEFQEKVKKKS
jgi:hypothetical protein